MIAFLFSQETGFDISCKLSSLETNCKKMPKSCFLGQIRKLSICRLLKILPRVLSVNNSRGCAVKQKFFLQSSMSQNDLLPFDYIKGNASVIKYSDIITKTYLYKFDPFKPHFYIVKLGFTGVYIIFLISAQNHRLWVLVRTASPRRF